MKVSDMLRVSRKYIVAGLLCLTMIIGFNATAYADWNYGIGTGLFRLNVEGDVGFGTQIPALNPVEVEVDLDPDDISDLMETAFGLTGYATDGKWMVNLSVAHLKLEDTVSSGPVSTTLGFEMNSGEITVGYPVYSTPQLILGVLGGARYTKHEVSADFTSPITVSSSFDNSWTDAVVGLTLTVPLAEKWVWNNRVDAGFGGSEGTYSGSTGVTWRFYKGLSGTLYGKYTAVEYENGNKGEADWYLYDADEFGVGLAILYNF